MAIIVYLWELNSLTKKSALHVHGAFQEPIYLANGEIAIYMYMK
jgi:hypothetical protein